MNDHAKHEKNGKNHKKEEIEHNIDMTDEDSFPASDPPSWSGGRTGGPKRNGHKDQESDKKDKK